MIDWLSDFLACQFLQVIGFISLVCTIFMLITYTLMKEKRSFPSNIITCMCGALFMFYWTILFNLGDAERVYCIDPITPSSPGNNTNHLCQTQC